MSWTDIFPVLSQEMVEEYRAGVTVEERAQYEEWLGVERVLPAVRGDGSVAGSNVAGSNVAGSEGALGKRRHGGTRHIVSATLFWKHVMGVDPELPVPTRERVVMAKRLGLVKRFSPWESYIEPLVRYSPQAMARHPEVTFRLYLARDLDFLIPDLTALGWEVHLMKSASLRYCPGGFWRFLALEDRRANVTVIDTDRMNEVDGEIARTQMMEQMGLGLWRVPGYYGVDNDQAMDRVRYRPLLGGHFGGRGGCRCGS